MSNQTIKLIKQFEKDLKKGKDVFCLSYENTQSVLIGLSRDTDINTLLIHSKNNGISSFLGHINKKHIDKNAKNTILLNLKNLSMPEVYIFDKENSYKLSDNLDDFIIILCEFDSSSILFYVFNTPYSTTGKKGLSSCNPSLTEYHRKIFLNTLPEDKYKEIQDALYSKNIDENEECL